MDRNFEILTKDADFPLPESNKKPERASLGGTLPEIYSVWRWKPSAAGKEHESNRYIVLGVSRLYQGVHKMVDVLMYVVYMRVGGTIGHTPLHVFLGEFEEIRV